MFNIFLKCSSDNFRYSDFSDISDDDDDEKKNFFITNQNNFAGKFSEMVILR